MDSLFNDTFADKLDDKMSSLDNSTKPHVGYNCLGPMIDSYGNKRIKIPAVSAGNGARKEIHPVLKLYTQRTISGSKISFSKIIINS